MKRVSVIVFLLLAGCQTVPNWLEIHVGKSIDMSAVELFYGMRDIRFQARVTVTLEQIEITSKGTFFHLTADFVDFLKPSPFSENVRLALDGKLKSGITIETADYFIERPKKGNKYQVTFGPGGDPSDLTELTISLGRDGAHPWNPMAPRTHTFSSGLK